MDNDRIPDLGKMRKSEEKPTPWFTLIARHPDTNEPLAALRIAPGLCLSIEADASINVSPLDQFDILPPDDAIVRKGDPNRPHVLTWIPNMAFAQAQTEAHNAGNGNGNTGADQTD